MGDSSLKWNWRVYVWHNNSSSVNDTALIFSKIELNGSKWDTSTTPHWTRVIVSLANIWQRHQSLRGNIGWWCDSAMWFLLLHYQSLQRWPGLGLPCPVMVSKEGKEGETVYGVVALKWVNNGESGKNSNWLDFVVYVAASRAILASCWNCLLKATRLSWGHCVSGIPVRG